MKDEQLVNLIADLKEKEALELAAEYVNTGIDPTTILYNTRVAMEIVGNRFQEGSYFLPQLIFAGEILRGISEIVKPKLTTKTKEKRLGKFLLGTVAGDIHDLGKDIVGFMLDINGFEVLDLGIDVPPQQFVEATESFKPHIVGLSGFLTLAYDSMKETVQQLNDADLRDTVKIMIGGGAIDDQVVKYTGADAYQPDAVAAVAQAKNWIGGK